MAVLTKDASRAAVRKPVTVTVVEVAGSREPRSQSSVPPVMESRMTQKPLVVETDVYVNDDGGASTRRTAPALAGPTFCTSIV